MERDEEHFDLDEEFVAGAEKEDFDRLLGDVHVRGCQRSYATYLGGPADRVLEVYGRHSTEAVATPGAKPPPDPDLRPPRRRDNARLVIMVAAAVLVAWGRSRASCLARMIL